MKKETKESTTSGSSGSFSAPMGFVSKRDIYKIHNRKKYNDEEVEEEEIEDIKEQQEEVGEATTTASSGAYDVPFGNGTKDPLKIGGEKTIKKRISTIKKKNFPKLGGPDGKFVTVKDKCKKFPYCNQGDSGNLEFHEDEKINEAINLVSKKYGLPRKEVEKLVINELNSIFI